ncbi:WD40-repeat-containing domain protein [Phlyctochytrium arcticum]|nr:WD40-repeat-containing domain protein [Phlyctochytrium arcticum]
MGFFLDTGNNSPEPAERNHVTIDLSDNEEQEEEQSEISTLDLTDPSNLPPAWEDDDTHVSVNISDAKRLRKLRTTFEENTISGKEYELRLRKQFEKLHPTPNWAVRPFREQHTGDTVNDLQRILRTTSSIIDTTQSRRTLNPDNLEVVRLKDANQAAYSQSVVQSVKFHPRAPVLLTAGYDRTVRLFQVDGKINPRIQSIYIKDLPIHRANFTPDGKEVLLTGKRNFFYSYNIEASSVQRIPGVRGQDETSYASSYMSPDNKHIAFLGRDGHIVLISRETKQWIATMKMNGSATSMDFSDDGQTIFSFGGDGEVYQWDIGSRKCIHKFVDEGCVKATTLAVSSGSRFIATGNESGVVNLYDHDKFSTASNPTPRKSILNLTTSITTMQFNRDSQILALASREKKDSLRLFHVPSQRIFKNWPTSQTPLGYVNCLDFSPGGGYLAIGNDKGKALLYRLSAYSAM